MRKRIQYSALKQSEVSNMLLLKLHISIQMSENTPRSYQFICYW